MMLCLVTDRRRLGAAMGVGPAEWVEVLRAQILAAASAGIDLIQVREPDLEGARLAHLVRTLVADTRHTASRLLVNERVDIALAARAAGVQLKERSYSAQAARRLAPPGFLIGRSIHRPADAVSAGADFLLAGTILPTASKPGAAGLGWAGLAAVVRASAGCPVLAIGGIDLPSTHLVAVSGAAGVAAIGAFIPTAGQGIDEFVQKRVIQMRLGFDSARPVS